MTYLAQIIMKEMDCLIKKIKTKYINAIHEAIKYCVNLNINVVEERNKKFFDIKERILNVK